MRSNYDFRIVGNSAIGRLPDGSEFVIDKNMVDEVSQFNFHLNRKGYAYTTKSKDKKNCFYLHWLVLGYKKQPPFIVDHINRNKLDCRASNLRIVTNQQNCMNRKIGKRNTSGYIGAFFYKPRNYYVSKICINNKRISLHHSKNLIECAQAYNIASELLFGKFAGHKNPVPPPTDELIKSVTEKCVPYMAEAIIATQPLVMSESA